MIHENEIAMLLIGMSVFITIMINKKSLNRLKNWKILLSVFSLFLCACIFTVLEGFFGENIFNYLEHICYVVSSVLMLIWCWTIFGKNEGGS